MFLGEKKYFGERMSYYGEKSGVSGEKKSCFRDESGILGSKCRI